MIRCPAIVHRQVREMVEHLWVPNAGFGHGFDHAERVYEHAVSMAKAERADVLVVGAAAYLMDAGLNRSSGRRDHVARGSEVARCVVQGIAELAPHCDCIVECIQYHEAESDVPDSVSLEARILHDSDTLDRMGFTGIAMTIAYGEWAGRRFHCTIDPMCNARSPVLDEYTLDYVIYTQTLDTRLLLPIANSRSARKRTETKTFLDRVRACLSRENLVDHAEARRVLRRCLGGLQDGCR